MDITGKAMIGGMKKDDGKVRYWTTVNTEGQDGGSVTASINVNLSKEATEVFNGCMKETKNAKIRVAYVTIEKAWFKAINTKNGPGIALFINKMAPEQKQDNAKW